MSESIQDVALYMHEVGRQARAASRVLARASSQEKNAALNAIADDLDRNHIALASANKKDLAAGAAKGLDSALMDRLELTRAHQRHDQWLAPDRFSARSHRQHL